MSPLFGRKCNYKNTVDTCLHNSLHHNIATAADVKWWKNGFECHINTGFHSQNLIYSARKHLKSPEGLDSSVILSQFKLELIISKMVQLAKVSMFCLNSKHSMHSSGQHRNVKPDTRLKNSVDCEVQRDLFGSDRPNQHCVSLFGKDLYVTDIHLYVRLPYCRFKQPVA